jgi:hypothetical protein
VAIVSSAITLFICRRLTSRDRLSYAESGICAFSSVKQSHDYMPDRCTVLTSFRCGLISSNVFRTSDAPRYLPGCHAMIFFTGLGVVHTIVCWIVYKRINDRREKFLMTTDKQFTEEELRELGDKAP